MSQKIKRSDIISLLSEACELEHGLACSYLYAAFSIKQSTGEGDLDWRQLQAARKWAGQLYFIASQEMFHLSQVWNILTAIGGTPYYWRPNFPQSHRYYPIDLPLVLEPFGKKSLKRFIFYELPEHISEKDYLEREFSISSEKINSSFTVGKLYETILNGLEQIQEKDLFIGSPSLQVGAETCHFSEIIKVTDLDSAKRAIHIITEQGEGTRTDQNDCHYGLYLSIEKEYERFIKDAESQGISFEPSRHIVSNPMPSFYAGQIPSGAHLIKDPYTEKVSILFDDIYSLMLRILQFVFQCGPLPNNQERIFADIAIQLMTRVIKPLGESLTLLPVGGTHSLNCGPAFGLYRHVNFPHDADEVIKLVEESLNQSLDKCNNLATSTHSPEQLHNAASNIGAIINYLNAFL